MTRLIKVPRPHRKNVKSLSDFTDLNRWASDVDQSIQDILHSLRGASATIADITSSTDAALVGAHASQHRPVTGFDPLPTAAPTSILGGTSVNSAGAGDSFARNDHSHDVGTAAHSGGYGTTTIEGSANELLRADTRLKYPEALASLANLSTLTLTDTGVDQVLTGSLGILNLNPVAGLTINLGASTLASLQIIPNAATAPQVTCFVNIRPALGNNIGLRSQFLAGAPTGAIAAWDAVVNPGGIYTGATLNGFYSSTFAATPGAGSDSNNKMYGINLGQQFRIGNANAGWLEVATAYFKGVTRLIGTPTITVQAGVIIEPPTASTSDQFGLLIRQQTAQAVATNRTGIRIDSQNSGTNRLSIDAQDKVLIVNPTGIGSDCLELRQNNAGAVAGAHILFSSKGGDPTGLTQGQLWHTGGLLKFYDTAIRVIVFRDAAETLTNKTLSGITMADATDVVLGTGTGTKFGTSTTQKLAFYGAAPIAQPANTVAINDVLVNLGLRASGGSANFSANIDMSTVNLVTDTVTGSKIGTSTTQKLGFWNAAPVAQPSATGVTTAGFTANPSANAVFAESTFTGNVGATAYSMSDVVANLKNAGLLAQ